MRLTRRTSLAGTASLLAGAWALPDAAAAPDGPRSIEPVVQAALAAVAQAKLAPGRYSRYVGPMRAQRPDGDKARSYGSAAAACILYAAGQFPRDTQEREAFIAYLRSGQSAETGMFSDANHSPTHATAYVLAALELFDADAAYPLRDLQRLKAPGGIEALLDGLDWRKPWPASHAGAGSFAALHLAGQASIDLQDRYAGWLAREQDPATGLWRKGFVRSEQLPDGAPLFDGVAAAFHYLFNLNAVRRPIPRPEALIDTALKVKREALHPALGRGPGFAELDWMYCLTRCTRQSGHRHAEVMDELRRFAVGYAQNLLALVRSDSTPFPDLHSLNGTMGALAELQQTLPGLLQTERPLRLTLDRRPFI